MSIFHKRQKQMETEQPGLTFLGYYVRRRTDLEWEWYCEDGAWHPAAADMPGKKMWQTKEEFEQQICAVAEHRSTGKGDGVPWAGRCFPIS